MFDGFETVQIYYNFFKLKNQSLGRFSINEIDMRISTPYVKILYEARTKVWSDPIYISQGRIYISIMGTFAPPKLYIF